LSGRWTLAGLSELRSATLDVTLPQGITQVRLDLAGLAALDTAGALEVVRLRRRLAARYQVEFSGVKPEHAILIAEIAKAEPQTEGGQPSRRTSRGLSAVALAATAIIRDFWRLTVFLGMVAGALGRVIANPKRFRLTAFVHQIQQTGLNAVPIVSLVCFLIGGVVMQQGAQQLRAFGAEALAVDMLGILTLREVGVLLAAVMVAGRSASAFTAQIGTMKMREEIDAMRTIGIDPIETLILPRVLALIVALPLLVFIANMMALAGGALMAKLYLNLDWPIYLQRLNGAIDGRHFYVGLIKAPFAALIIALVGCLEGMSVEGSAESVGSQVTTAVVKAIFLVLVLDGVFAIFLSASGF
jgi:phospholipid/cholesterol/gamma-HCH transport system permease protein